MEIIIAILSESGRIFGHTILGFIIKTTQNLISHISIVDMSLSILGFQIVENLFLLI